MTSANSDFGFDKQSEKKKKKKKYKIQNTKYIIAGFITYNGDLICLFIPIKVMVSTALSF